MKKDGKPVYFSGDGAIIDEKGYITITGRTDDVVNVSGHRIGTAEIESAIAKHPSVAESACVSRLDSITGESLFAYIVLHEGVVDNTAEELEIMKEINRILSKEIGNIAKLGAALFVPGLPKTRSGKIMRRILKAIARNEAVTQDVSTLEDPQIVEKIAQIAKNAE